VAAEEDPTVPTVRLSSKNIAAERRNSARLGAEIWEHWA
jgi:hypothetical protein